MNDEFLNEVVGDIAHVLEPGQGLLNKIMLL